MHRYRMQPLDIIFIVAIIVMSAVVHELMHGVAADSLGDRTARYAGRLTLNPVAHLDPFGSVLLPLVLAFSGSPLLFGWAKPVPYNPYNLKPGRFSEAIVAAAGPLSNLAIALLFGLIVRLAAFPGASDIFFTIVVVNVMLFLFNLIPIPPLDGSKILSALLPGPLGRSYVRLRDTLEYNPFMGMGLVIIVILLVGSGVSGAIYALARVIAGV